MVHADVDADLPLTRRLRGRAADLLERPAAEWSLDQVQLAQGLAALVELRRLAAAGGGPANLLAVAARAHAVLPDDLHGLVVLAASGRLVRRSAAACPEASGSGTAVA
jgi:hypothetical protein